MGLYIILMGVQGAGKGVQAAYISETYGIPHISTGDVFRAMKTREDELAQKVQRIMAEGLLVDDATTNEVVADRLSQDDAQNGVILDGYPRNRVQAEFLDNYLAEKDDKINAVLLLNLDLFVAFKRAFGRVSAPDGASYNYFYKRDDVDWQLQEDKNGEFPPKLVASLDGQPLKRRGDDANGFAVIKRIDTYLETTLPLLDYYREKGIVHEINAEQTIEAVSNDIKSIIDAAR